jgi:hypothetical protein
MTKKRANEFAPTENAAVGCADRRICLNFHAIDAPVGTSYGRVIGFLLFGQAPLKRCFLTWGILEIGMKKLLVTMMMLLAAGVAMAGDTIHSFSTDKGRVEVFVGSGNMVYIKTSVNTWSTGFEYKGSSSCNYQRPSGKCISQSDMLSEIESKTRSGDYWH